MLYNAIFLFILSSKWKYKHSRTIPSNFTHFDWDMGYAQKCQMTRLYPQGFGVMFTKPYVMITGVIWCKVILINVMRRHQWRHEFQVHIRFHVSFSWMFRFGVVSIWKMIQKLCMATFSPKVLTLFAVLVSIQKQRNYICFVYIICVG